MTRNCRCGSRSSSDVCYHHHVSWGDHGWRTAYRAVLGSGRQNWRKTKYVADLDDCDGVCRAGRLFIRLFPQPIMGLTTDSQEVIELGSSYLVISSASMFAVACVASMAVGLRAMHQPGLSTFFSGIGILSNVFLNWVLIFGHLGFPALVLPVQQLQR